MDHLYFSSLPVLCTFTKQNRMTGIHSTAPPRKKQNGKISFPTSGAIVSLPFIFFFFFFIRWIRSYDQLNKGLGASRRIAVVVGHRILFLVMGLPSTRKAIAGVQPPSKRIYIYNSQVPFDKCLYIYIERPAASACFSPRLYFIRARV